MPLPFVITVILNTNRCTDTLDALDSLEKSTYGNHSIIVLDNASTDNSVEFIRKEFPEVEIIQLTENLGYAGNNNVGIEAALERGADWVFVLNEDTVLAKDCLEFLIAKGESDPAIGIVGPMVYHFDEPEIIQSAGGSLGPLWQSHHIGQNEKDIGQYKNERDVEWISGCAVLVRRQTIEQIGPLDARFFYYWEETEWCLRARKNGWRIVHTPQAKLWHKGVQRDYQPSPSVTYYSTRNRLLMFSKHKAPIKVWGYAIWDIFRTMSSWTFKPKWKSKREHRNAMGRGFLDFLRGSWGMR